ncbi:hypothetical protein FB45DRAFT_864430 [Roridomyces roridus]|uniref:Transmembrane protein n=1 Tax=Roridomyces roridus TaxID=1738132 RepID=A0AAD7C188_9AGAR|nr:hypothetical protein FB45DRAFT_864430 [Roridomyces roridus]
MSTVEVIVDDHDSRVHYSPSTGWTGRGDVQQFMQTTSAAVHSGSETATFSFNGTSVIVYGKLAPTGTGAVMAFSVDGSPPASFTAPPTSVDSEFVVHHQILFTADALPHGTHNLTMTQTSGDGQIFLDFFLLDTTSPAVGDMLFIDDSDPVLDYSPGWVAQPSSDEFFQNTGRSCDTDECTVSLSFNGTSFSIFGALSASQAPAAWSAFISIDGSPPTAIHPPSPTATNTSANLLIFSGQPLPGLNNNHTVVFTTHSTDQLFLDYILVEAAPLSNTQVTSSSHRVPVATIVGSIVGVFAFLLIASLSFWVWRRRANIMLANSPAATPIAPTLPTQAQPLSVPTWSIPLPQDQSRETGELMPYCVPEPPPSYRPTRSGKLPPTSTRQVLRVHSMATTDADGSALAVYSAV